MNKILETDTYKINFSSSLECLAQKTIFLLDKKINEYKAFKTTYFNDKHNFLFIKVRKKHQFTISLFTLLIVTI